MLLTGLFGTAIGALAGYFRRLDNPLMRLMDAFMAVPAILLAIAMAANDRTINARDLASSGERRNPLRNKSEPSSPTQLVDVI